jgi:PAS domain S-box-containing protein
VVSAVHERKVTASLRRLQLTLLLSGLALGVAALAFSLLVASKLVRPIEVLTHAARGVPQGDFERPVPRNAPGELGDLASAFVGMRGDLQATLRGLRESEEKYRQSIDSAADPIYAVDPRSGLVLHANRRAEDLAGVAPGALEGRFFADVLVPEERQLALDYVAQLASPTGSTRLADGHLLDHAQGLLPVSISGSRIVHGGGSFVLLICSDLTERKRMESELVQAEKMSTVGILAAGILHELNTPLTYLLANLEDAGPRLARLAPHNEDIRLVHEAVQEAIQGAHRAAEIGRDLRSFARTAKAEDGSFDLREAVRLALRLARHELRNRAHVVTEFGEVPPVVGHPTEISQVFLNLLVNAAHAIPAGQPDRHRVRIVTLAREGRGVARVEDSGSGIGPDLLARIFEPFFTTKPDGVGTGLGLSISRDIVRRVGGEIHVESRVGVGTTFIVEIPFAA